MLEALSVRPRICQQIRSGPLGPWIDGFVDVLAARGVRDERHSATRPSRSDPRRVAQGVRGSRRSRLTRRSSPVSSADCRDGRRRSAGTAGSRRWQAAFDCSPDTCAPRAWWRLRSRQPIGPRRSSGYRDFDDHLVQVHGLVGGTRRIYRRHAGAFLAECVGGPTPDWSPGSPFQRLQRSCRPASAGSVPLRVGIRRPPRGRCCASW